MSVKVNEVLATSWPYTKVATRWAWQAIKWIVHVHVLFYGWLWRVTKGVARGAWFVAKKVTLVLSYVFFFLPTLLFRSHKTKERRHQEMIEALKKAA